jgi:hypothetical protein
MRRGRRALGRRRGDDGGVHIRLRCCWIIASICRDEYMIQSIDKSRMFMRQYCTMDMRSRRNPCHSKVVSTLRPYIPTHTIGIHYNYAAPCLNAPLLHLLIHISPRPRYSVSPHQTDSPSVSSPHTASTLCSTRPCISPCSW